MIEAVRRGFITPKTKLVNLKLVSACTESGITYNVYEGTIANPRNVDVALVTTPPRIMLAEDHEAIVGTDTDELGIADAVCVKKGQKAIKTDLLSDIPLETGDRLTGFLELDFDPETGETFCGAWLEY